MLTPLAQNTSSVQTFTNFDLAYAGNYAEWVKFANTLKLRLAIRIALVDPTKAKTEGESALANPVGLMTTFTDNLNVNIQGSGTVEYVGQPKVEQTVAGEGTIRPLQPKESKPPETKPQ